jgi:hypothetical protein
LNKRTSTGAKGRFNIWNLQQIQLSTDNPEAKASTVSSSSLEGICEKINLTHQLKIKKKTETYDP